MVDLALLIEARDAAKSGRAERLRRAAGVSQAELAGAVGVDASTVSRWERGRRLPRAPVAIAYARALRTLANEISHV